MAPRSPDRDQKSRPRARTPHPSAQRDSSRPRDASPDPELEPRTPKKRRPYSPGGSLKVRSWERSGASDGPSRSRRRPSEPATTPTLRARFNDHDRRVASASYLEYNRYDKPDQLKSEEVFRTALRDTSPQRPKLGQGVNIGGTSHPLAGPLCELTLYRLGNRDARIKEKSDEWHKIVKAYYRALHVSPGKIPAQHESAESLEPSARRVNSNPSALHRTLPRRRNSWPQYSDYRAYQGAPPKPLHHRANYLSQAWARDFPDGGNEINAFGYVCRECEVDPSRQCKRHVDKNDKQSIDAIGAAFPEALLMRGRRNSSPVGPRDERLDDEAAEVVGGDEGNGSSTLCKAMDSHALSTDSRYPAVDPPTRALTPVSSTKGFWTATAADENTRVSDGNTWPNSLAGFTSSTNSKAKDDGRTNSTQGNASTGEDTSADEKAGGSNAKEKDIIVYTTHIPDFAKHPSPVLEQKLTFRQALDDKILKAVLNASRREYEEAQSFGTNNEKVSPDANRTKAVVKNVFDCWRRGTVLNASRRELEEAQSFHTKKSVFDCWRQGEDPFLDITPDTVQVLTQQSEPSVSRPVLQSPLHPDTLSSVSSDTSKHDVDRPGTVRYAWKAFLDTLDELGEGFYPDDASQPQFGACSLPASPEKQPLTPSGDTPRTWRRRSSTPPPYTPLTPRSSRRKRKTKTKTPPPLRPPIIDPSYSTDEDRDNVTTRRLEKLLLRDPAPSAGDSAVEIFMAAQKRSADDVGDTGPKRMRSREERALSRSRAKEEAEDVSAVEEFMASVADASPLNSRRSRSLEDMSKSDGNETQQSRADVSDVISEQTGQVTTKLLGWFKRKMQTPSMHDFGASGGSSELSELPSELGSEPSEHPLESHDGGNNESADELSGETPPLYEANGGRLDSIVEGTDKTEEPITISPGDLGPETWISRFTGSPSPVQYGARFLDEKAMFQDGDLTTWEVEMLEYKWERLTESQLEAAHDLIAHHHGNIDDGFRVRCMVDFSRLTIRCQRAVLSYVCLVDPLPGTYQWRDGDTGDADRVSDGQEDDEDWKPSPVDQQGRITIGGLTPSEIQEIGAIDEVMDDMSPKFLAVLCAIGEMHWDQDVDGDCEERIVDRELETLPVHIQQVTLDFCRNHPPIEQIKSLDPKDVAAQWCQEHPQDRILRMFPRPSIKSGHIESPPQLSISGAGSPEQKPRRLYSHLGCTVMSAVVPDEISPSGFLRSRSLVSDLLDGHASLVWDSSDDNASVSSTECLADVFSVDYDFDTPRVTRKRTLAEAKLSPSSKRHERHGSPVLNEAAAWLGTTHCLSSISIGGKPKPEPSGLARSLQTAQDLSHGSPYWSPHPLKTPRLSAAAVARLDTMVRKPLNTLNSQIAEAYLVSALISPMSINSLARGLARLDPETLTAAVNRLNEYGMSGFAELAFIRRCALMTDCQDTDKESPSWKDLGYPEHNYYVPYTQVGSFIPETPVLRRRSISFAPPPVPPRHPGRQHRRSDAVDLRLHTEDSIDNVLATTAPTATNPPRGTLSPISPSSQIPKRDSIQNENATPAAERRPQFGFDHDNPFPDRFRTPSIPEDRAWGGREEYDTVIRRAAAVKAKTSASPGVEALDVEAGEQRRESLQVPDLSPLPPPSPSHERTNRGSAPSIASSSSSMKRRQELQFELNNQRGSWTPRAVKSSATTSVGASSEGRRTSLGPAERNMWARMVGAFSLPRKREEDGHEEKWGEGKGDGEEGATGGESSSRF